MHTLINKLKSWRWDKQKEQEMCQWARDRYRRKLPIDSNTSAREPNLVFLCEEFFHPDLRGYGGFGKTVKNIAENINSDPSEHTKVALAYPQAVNFVNQPEAHQYHGTSVVLRPHEDKTTFAILNRYGDLLADLNPRVLISIDWYPSYAVPSYALSSTPLIIWIHDPRDKEEWEKIAGIADELRFRGAQTSSELIALANEKRISINKLISLGKLLQRKIIFCTTARTLIPRAERTYGIKPIKAHWLPNPIDIPEVQSIEFSEKPTLLYLGRLDAVKRPWIAFELAKRNPNVDFLIAGHAHNLDLMTPWIDRYKHLPNLKLLGHIDGPAKDQLLRSCWAVLNTSVHEAEPVSFLEAFSYAKCVISCHDPDNEVSNFGFFTGEVLGEGLEEESLLRFDTQIRKLLSSPQERLMKGQLGREEMIKNHTFDSFKAHLRSIFEAEGIA